MLHNKGRKMADNLTDHELLAAIAERLEWIYDALCYDGEATPGNYNEAFYTMLKDILLLQTDCNAAKDFKKVFSKYLETPTGEVRNEAVNQAEYWR